MTVVKAILKKRQPLPSGFDGLRAVQMAYGVYESSRSGKNISLWGDKEADFFKAYTKAEGSS